MFFFLRRETRWFSHVPILPYLLNLVNTFYSPSPSGSVSKGMKYGHGKQFLEGECTSASKDSQDRRRLQGLFKVTSWYRAHSRRWRFLLTCLFPWSRPSDNVVLPSRPPWNHLYEASVWGIPSSFPYVSLKQKRATFPDLPLKRKGGNRGISVLLSKGLTREPYLTHCF